MRAAIPQPNRFERAAGMSCCGADDKPGQVWRAKAPLPDDRLPWGLCLLIWAALLVPIWAGIVALLRGII